MTIIDIETRPRLDLVARYLKPYPEFDPAAVKTGNIKDPAKINEKIADERQKHEQAALDYRRKAEERAGLDPLTSEIVAVGFLDGLDGTPEIAGADKNGGEAGLIQAIWSRFLEHSEAGNSWVFWSGNGNPTENFDADMLIRRSWILGVKVPARVFNGRFISDRLVDASARYLLGKRDAYCSLSDAADQLGIFEAHPELHRKDKEHDLVTGQTFHLFMDGKADVDMPPEAQRQLALAYLRNDLQLLAAIVDRIF